MIVLHGSWLPQSASNTPGGCFFLWAEAEAQPALPRRGRPPRLSAGTARPHPSQVDPAELRAAWQELAPKVELRAEEACAAVWLPSAAGRPLPAPELFRVVGAVPKSQVDNLLKKVLG